MEIIYTGWFVSPDALYDAVKDFAPNRLEQPAQQPHVTLEFRPQEINTALLGSPARLTVTGYANDGENEGISVTVEQNQPALASQLDTLSRPHITLSVSAEGKPVNTARLDFRPVPPRTLTGTFGAFTEEGTVAFSPEEIGCPMSNPSL